MSEADLQRQKSNETATFNKIKPQPFKSQDLSSIAQENDPQNLQSSLSLPKPLIQNEINDSQLEFTNISNKQIESKVVQPPTSNNITFYPRFANRLLYQQTDLSTLKQEQNKLKGQLSGLNQMIDDLVNKKSDLLNEYEEIVKERKCYKRLKKNLEQEYQGYLFMLEGDYCQKLDEETEKQKIVLNKLKREVHALNYQLSKPLGSNGYRQASHSQTLEKQFFQLQINEQKLKLSNKRKQQRLSALRQKNAEKEAEIKQTIKKIDKLEYERQIDDIYPQETKANQQQYEQLTKKLNKLKKITDTNLKVKELQFYRKVKEGKEKDLTNHNLGRQIDQANQRIYKLLVQLQRAKQNSSKFSTFQHQGKKIKTQPNNDKKKIPLKQDLKHFVSQKNKLSIQHQENDRKQSKSLARVHTQAVQNVDDRPELLMRRKKIYTQLQRNMYFKNIENSEQQKISRVYETEVKSKDRIGISSYQRFNNQNVSKELKLPQIEHYRLKTEGNDSIIYNYDKKINKRSIDMHNRHIKQLRTNKHRLHSQSNYRQLCNILNRDRLLIEEDCEYDVSQLIYSGQS